MARRASFCEVWWIPSPILDARRLNSECADAAERESSRGPPLADAEAAEEEAGDGATWRRALSTAERNSLVRSRNDAGEDRDGWFIVADDRRCRRRIWIWIWVAASVGRGAGGRWVGIDGFGDGVVFPLGAGGRSTHARRETRGLGIWCEGTSWRMGGSVILPSS